MYQHNHKSKFTTNDVKNLGNWNREKPGFFQIRRNLNKLRSGTWADNKSDKNNDNADETGTETFTDKKTWNCYIIITHFEQIKTA